MEIVIAHYNNFEFEDFIKLFPNAHKILYDKSNNYNKCIDNLTIKKMINVGREGETYLSHIIENYYHLSEYTLFIQDDTEQHIKDYNQFKIDTDNIINKNSKFYLYSVRWRKGYSPSIRTIVRGQNNLPALKNNVIKIACLKNNIHLPYIYNTPTCAFFICHKDIILKRPIEFYINLRNWLLENDENGYVLEHIWKIIFI